MDYLKPLFASYLNEEGPVEIAGYSFRRDSILETMEAAGYQDAFLEWCDLRKADNLSLAEEILALHDNSQRFMRMKTIYHSGALTPFVGAGLSVPSGYPGWTAFLYSLLPETRVDRDEFERFISSGDFEGAAQILHDDLPPGCFLEQVENEFGCSREIQGPVQRLAYAFNEGAVITTNFDEVLSKCYQLAGFPFQETLLAAEAIELPRLLGEGKRVLVKLHGKANTSRSRVFLKSEYEKHYGQAENLQSVFEAVTNRSLLFLGCSLTVDRTIQCMAGIVQGRGIENIPRHYAFLKLEDHEDRRERRQQLARANIYPIWYTGDHDECIEALLEALVVP